MDIFRIKKKKKPKYLNKKFMGYDSQKEAGRAMILKDMQKQGKITSLNEQVPFVLLESFKDSSGKTERGIKYIADFVYYDLEEKQLVIEDVKSPMTKKLPAYVIKRKLVKHFYPNYKFIES